MKYNSKLAIMGVFETFPNIEMTTDDFFRRARQVEAFIPTSLNTHLSQLCKRGSLRRPERGVYIFDAPVEVKEETAEQMQLC